MNRQPDDPSGPHLYMTEGGKLYRQDASCNWVEEERKSFWRFLLDRWRDDWNRNSYAVLVAICVCIGLGLLTFALGMLP